MKWSAAAGFAVILFVLCAVMQIQSAGWGALYNETDGQYAGAARVMAEGGDWGDWLIPQNNGVPRLVKPPLLYWMIAGSMRVFGIDEFAARLPNAIGVTAWVLATFAIGGLLGGAWRGFVAGIVLLTSLGTATLARIVMPEPVFCAFIAWAIYCGLRAVMVGDAAWRRWVVGFWVLAGLAVFTKGLHGLVFPLVIVGMSALVVAEWRARAWRLASVVGVGIFLLINVPWYWFIESRYPGVLANLFWVEQWGHVAGSAAPATSYTNVPRGQFLLLHLAWLFPWSVIGIAEAVRLGLKTPQVDTRTPLQNFDAAASKFCGREISRAAVFVAVWVGVVFLAVLVAGQRQDYYAMVAWPALALAVAAVVERGISWVGVVAFGGVCAGALVVLPMVGGGDSAAVAERATAWTTMVGLDGELWGSLAHLGRLSLGFALVALVGALAMLAGGRRMMAMRAVMLAAASLSFGAMAGYARVAPYFSVAEMAPTLRELARRGVRIAYDGGVDTGSSLLFYVGDEVTLIGQNPEEDFLTRTEGLGRDRYLTVGEFAGLWREGAGVALVTEAGRSEFWRERLGEMSPPVATSGTQVVYLMR